MKNLMNWRLTKPILRFLLAFVSLAPWLTVLAVYSLAFSVRISYGRWPEVYKDSPTLPHVIDAVLPYVMFPSLAGIIVFPITWAVCLAACVVSDRKQKLLSAILTFVLGFTIMFALGRLDPWGFQEWFWD